jgi:hypothetical protein
MTGRLPDASLPDHREDDPKPSVLSSAWLDNLQKQGADKSFARKNRVQNGRSGIKVPSRMCPTAVTKDAKAVEAEVRSAYVTLFPDGDNTFVARAFGWAVRCFAGGFNDYQAVDVPYHDLEHTLQGTLCMTRLLRARHFAEAQPRLTERGFQLGLLAILLHDTGYLKKRNDAEGTGAKYTVTHVHRSAQFAAELLAEQKFPPSDIRAVQNMIHCTGMDSILNSIPFQNDLERIIGYALGTADLLGQMSAEDYVDRLPELYSEFAEAAHHSKDRTHFVFRYSSAEDLMKQTPEFWTNNVQRKLNRDFAALYQFLNDPYPQGPNPYVQRIEANMERLRKHLAGASREG